MKEKLITIVGFTVFLGFLMLGYVWQHTPAEKYSPIIESVQDETVMIAVPTVIERVVITFSDGKMDMHTATAPVTMLGAGVLVSKRGLILSCAHVVANKPSSPIIATLSDGTTVPAKVLYKDKTMDLALLKISSYNRVYHTAVLSPFPLRLGQEVIVVGNPEGQEFSSSHGIISHLERDIDEPFTYTQIDAPVNHGNSGGPVFNLQGKLIGIVAQKWNDSDGLALAISPYTIQMFLDQFRGL